MPAWPDALDRDRLWGDSGDSGRPLVSFPRPGRKVLMAAKDLPSSGDRSQGSTLSLSTQGEETEPQLFPSLFFHDCKRVRTQEIPEISTKGKS